MIFQKKNHPKTATLLGNLLHFKNARMVFVCLLKKQAKASSQNWGAEIPIHLKSSSLYSSFIYAVYTHYFTFCLPLPGLKEFTVRFFKTTLLTNFTRVRL